MKSNNIFKSAIILFVITFIAGALLGIAYEVTKEPIRKQEELAKEKALQTVSNKADTFEKSEIEPYTNGLITILEINKAYNGEEFLAYDFIIETKEGYGGVIELVVGISKKGEVTGVEILNHSETPGLGEKATESKFKDQFKDKEADIFTLTKVKATKENEIDSIGGATITSDAVTNAVNESIAYYNDKLKGAQTNE